MAGTKDPHRFAGKMGINTGPIPIKQWMAQPSVNVDAAKHFTPPNAGQPQKQGNGRRNGKE